MLKKETKENDQEKNEDKFILQINKDRREQKYFFFISLNSCIHFTSMCFLLLLQFAVLDVFILLLLACAADCMLAVLSCCFILLKIGQNPCFTPLTFFFSFLLFLLYARLFTLFSISISFSIKTME